MQKTILTLCAKLLRYGLFTLGSFAFVLLVLSFTSLPYKAYQCLGASSKNNSVKADLIVLMGASGMPSPAGLMRCYYAALAAKAHPNAKLVVALPNHQQAMLMVNELRMRGVRADRIFLEVQGSNTRTQALQIAKRYSTSNALLVVSSPEHIYRSVKVFNKLGFKTVGAYAANEQVLAGSELNQKQNDSPIEQLSLRYNTWSYLHYEVFVLREYAAISYYYLKGWL